MGQILEQLELNNTFLMQFAIFAVLFFILTRVFFLPFLQLFEIRRKRTVEDRDAAEKMMTEADQRLNEYRARLQQERQNAKKEFESVVTDARRAENEILSHARDEAKKITQETNESIAHQREQLRKQIEADIESLANGVSERLLSRKG